MPTAAEGTATVTVTAANSGGSASASFRATVTKPFILPLLVVAPVVAGPAKIGQALTLQGGSWSGFPDPVVSRQWLRDGADIPGATGASYTPVPADDLKPLCCRVTATNLAGSAVTVTAGLTATYVAPVAKGELDEEIFDVGPGVETVVAGPDFVGANLSFAVTGAGATIDLNGVVSIPTDKPVQALVTVTATNSGGSATSSFQVTVEAEDIPFALEAEDIEIVASVWRPAAQETWFTPLLRFPGLAGETVHAVEWTTGKDPVTDAQFEVATWTGNAYQLYMRDPARNDPGAVPRVDYSVWKAEEARRNDLRFRWRRTAQGPWSAPSPKVSVPAPVEGWLPLIHRSKEQFEQRIVGGGGFQFFRSWGYSPARPDRLFGVQDIDIPIRTEDFGDWWESAPCVGLKVGISGQGCAIDSQDGDRILVMYSASSRRFLTGWNAQSGIYLSTDGGDSFALVQQLDDISGSAEGTNGDQPPSRFMQFPFVEVPGGTPATRKWYAFQRKVPKGAPATDGALWRSTDGGQAWARSGETLTVAKFGDRLYVMRRAANGDFYFGTSKGLFRSTDEGGSWSKLASLPAGSVLEIDVRGPAGEVWAAVDGVGLYRSTNHGASWTARKTGYDLQTFAISPHDRNRILIAGQNVPQRMKPQYSLNGGGSWSDIDTQPFPGQPEAFQSLIQGSHAYFIFHATDPNLVFAARYQHFGKSTDGGKTFVWASNNFDYNYVHDIAVDPGDWTQMALAMQDRMLVFTQNGHDWIWDDAIDEAIKAELETQAGYTGHTGAGRGALILRNGTNRRIISGAGNGTKHVTIVHATSGDNPIGKCSVPNHNGKVSWCLLGANDAVDPSRGYIGRWRYELSASGVLAGPIDVTYEVVGVGSGAGVVFGVEKGSGEAIRRSTDYGATWSVWATAPEEFRPIDAEPVLVTDRSKAARLLMVTASGKAYLIEGAAAPTTRLVFDLRAQIGAGYPAYELYHCAFDPHDPNVAYVTANVYGGPSIFRTLDLLSGAPTWTDISGNGPRQPRKVYVHPVTGEVITSYHHGSMIHPAPAGQHIALGITTSLYDRVGAFPGIRR